MSKMGTFVLEIEERIMAGQYSDEIVSELVKEYGVTERYAKQTLCDVLMKELSCDFG